MIPRFRKEVFVTTKSLERSRKGAEQELHRSLKRMKTDYVDLWQIHAVATMDDVEQIFALLVLLELAQTDDLVLDDGVLEGDVPLRDHLIVL